MTNSQLYKECKIFFQSLVGRCFG